MPFPVVALSKAWICGRLLAVIVGSNPTGGQGCLSLLSVVKQRFLSRADNPYRGLLPSVACLSVIVKPR